jgi:tetratricopeptide (TPR) repeat protein
MTTTPEPVGTLETALAHTARLLERQPALAIEQANEILKVAPGHPPATLLLGKALLANRDSERAVATLAELTKQQPNWALAHFEYGVALAARDRGDEAVAALRRAVTLKPDLADAWRALADHLTAIGDERGADQAYAQSVRASTRDPRLLEPAAALVDGRIAVAETLLRQHLKQHPTDVAAIRMLAEVAARLGRYADSETLLSRCLELAPGFTAARQNHAHVLHRQNRTHEALGVVEKLLLADPNNPSLLSTKASYLARLGDFDQSIALYNRVLRQYPNQAKLHLSYGHALKTAGRQADSIEAYRRCIERAPQTGEAYWSLANLKRFRFSQADVATMRSQLSREDLAAEDRYHFDFALGKALEDEGDYAASFEHYAKGNALARPKGAYDADETTRKVERAIAFFTPELLERQSGHGATAREPIFILGMPRAGSTLLEQILSSHSQVEGTAELPDITMIARKLTGRQRRGDSSQYPQVLATLSPVELRALGEEYLERTRIQRRTTAPCFIDKMPNNWLHVGLIHLILPNARVIDARRHPLSCCFSNFKQHFARGQSFTYDLGDLGRYYRDYVTLLAHFDAVLPGRVHRVYYERMVENTENEIRGLLEYCGLPFEESCLRFYETERAVRTASSEQVRSPIYREALDQWRHFEPWLDPLKDALGPFLDTCPPATI